MPTLWYDLRTPDEALDEVISLRGDPHVERIEATNLMRAIRDEQATGSVEVEFRPGETRFADHTQPRLGTFRPVTADFEFIACNIQEGLQVTDEQMQEASLRGREFLQRMIQRAVMDTPRREFHPRFGTGVNSLRQNIDYQAIGRRTFLLDELPPPPQYSPLWPDWCQVGATVYDERRSPFKVAKVGTEVELWSVEDNGEDTRPLRIVLLISTPKELEKYSPRRPRSRWERLGD